MYPWNLTSHAFDKQSDSILFFSPEAGVLPHYVALCTLARTMQERGYNVYLINCGTAVNRCPVMDMHSTPFTISRSEQLEHFCAGCTQIHKNVSDFYNIKSITLSDFLSPEDRQRVNQTIDSFNGELSKLHFEGYRLGNLGLADYALVTKQAVSTGLDSAQYSAARQYTETAMLAYLATRRVIQKFSVKRLCAFNIYSYMLGAACAAEEENVPFINVTQVAHMDIDRQRYVILPRVYTSEVWRDLCNDWYRWQHLAIAPHLVKEIAEDLFARELGKGAQHYSIARSKNQQDLVYKLKLDPQKKTVVLFTSGFDENFSINLINRVFGSPSVVDMTPFSDQLEWIRRVMNFVKNRSDLQLVVRIHPREGRNKREQFLSSSSSKLAELSDFIPDNCRFIQPEESISSYDLIELADLGLTAWSTIGLEMARRGVPVLAAFRHTGTPDDISIPWGGDTAEDYFNSLDTLLNSAGSLEKIRQAFRCYAYWQFSNALRLDDSIPSPSHEAPAPFILPREAHAIEAVMVEGLNLPVVNRARLINQQSTELPTQERNEITRFLRELIYLYLMGNRPAADYSLSLIRNIADPSQTASVLGAHSNSARTAAITLRGSHVDFTSEGRQTSRFSPLIARLAPLCSQQIVG